MLDYSAISDEPDVEFARRMTIEYGCGSHSAVGVLQTAGKTAKCCGFVSPNMTRPSSKALGSFAKYKNLNCPQKKARKHGFRAFGFNGQTVDLEQAAHLAGLGIHVGCA